MKMHSRLGYTNNKICPGKLALCSLSFTYEVSVTVYTAKSSQVKILLWTPNRCIRIERTINVQNIYNSKSNELKGNRY